MSEPSRLVLPTGEPTNSQVPQPVPGPWRFTFVPGDGVQDELNRMNEKGYQVDPTNGVRGPLNVPANDSRGNQMMVLGFFLIGFRKDSQTPSA